MNPPDHPSRDALIAAAATLPLDRIDVGQPLLFQLDAFWPYFARLRREAPVHYCASSEFGPFWSITKYKHIMQIEANTEVFSSDVKYGGITLRDQMPDFVLPMFIAMDPPRHDQQRAAVQPIVGPPSLARLEQLVRERAQAVLDGLPIGETFNWVQHVSIELTTSCWRPCSIFPGRTGTSSPAGRTWRRPCPAAASSTPRSSGRPNSSSACSISPGSGTSG
jgi:cytochrome P450